LDDDSRWRTELSDTLTRHGMIVDTAGTVTETLTLLTQRLYHIIVLDIRIEHTSDDDGGLKVLRSITDLGLNSVVKTIILSSRGTLDRMRDAFRLHGVADFLEKRTFDNREFLALVQNVLSQMSVNLDLSIHWRPTVDIPSQLVKDLALGDPPLAPRDSAQAERAVRELEDLLCRLFSDSDSIIAKPLIPGLSHAKVMWVKPFFDLGGARPVIVKFGSIGEIKEELHRYEQYVKRYIVGVHSTVVLDQRRTSRIGGVAYSLVNTADEQIQHFGKFHAASDIEDIKFALERLFFDTCQPWYENPGRTVPCNLAEEYQALLKFSPDRILRALASELDIVEDSGNITFPDLPDSRTFANPVHAMVRQNMTVGTYRCITHGDFNPNNILVDTNKQTWLIDFERTCESHYLRDVAQLDAVMRVQLLPPESASLEERLQLEEALTSTMTYDNQKRLETKPQFKSSQVAKAFELSVYLQDIARRLVPQLLHDDPAEYAAAQFYTTLNMVKFAWLPMIQRKHALISACLMADHIQG
jgi:DNA-binding response OmpR family regulator